MVEYTVNAVIFSLLIPAFSLLIPAFSLSTREFSLSIQEFSVLIAAVAASFSAISAKSSLKSIEKNYAFSKSQILFAAMNHYILIQKDKTTALEKKSTELCSQYYREMFDLYWTEYKLWSLDYIDNECMRSWMQLAGKNYFNGSLEIKDENNSKITITYKEVWDKLVTDKYFNEHDGFVDFMKQVHDNNIEAALNKEKKRS